MAAGCYAANFRDTTLAGIRRHAGSVLPATRPVWGGTRLVAGMRPPKSRHINECALGRSLAISLSTAPAAEEVTKWQRLGNRTTKHALTKHRLAKNRPARIPSTRNRQARQRTPQFPGQRLRLGRAGRWQ